MKTTIEINGYQIVVEENEGSISVSALKDEEVVEEFTIEIEEGGDDLQAFDAEEESEEGFEGEEDGEDFGDEGEEDLEGEEDFDGDDFEGEEDVEEESGKLESFNTFVRKRK